MDPRQVRGATVTENSAFLMYINDLPNNINSTVRQFGDDYVMCTSIRNTPDFQQLQSDLGIPRSQHPVQMAGYMADEI